MTFFYDKVDELVLNADPELKEGLRFIEEEAKKSGLNTYDVIKNMVIQDHMKTSVTQWVNDHS